MFLGAKRLGAGSISKKKMHYLLSISFDFFHQQFLLYFLVQCSSYNKKSYESEILYAEKRSFRQNAYGAKIIVKN